MIRKLLILTLCLTISGCIGFNTATGLKFKTGDDRVVELKNGTFISFEKPIGNCGVRIIFFGVILPIIPIWFSSNSCDKGFDIAFTTIISNPKLGREINIKLKYSSAIHDPVEVEKVSEYYYALKGEQRLQYERRFKFKIDNFEKFKEVNDKAMLISGKIDEKDFTEELPVKWGVMFYKNPSIPW
jgi:hypothetical protein